MKRSISLITVSFIIISLILTSQSIAALDSETVVGMWLFDRGTGKVAEDSSENGNDGEFKGSRKWVTGKFGKALEFDGADDWVNMGNNPILKPETNADGNVLKQVKSGPKAVEDKFQEFHIGKPNNAGAYFIKGTIDEVALFNVALDENTIKSIMNKGLEGALAVSPSGKLTTAWGAIKTYR